MRWLSDGTKNDATVKFAFEAEMGTVAYTLTAVIGHQGPSVDTGHYAACTLSNRQWLLCDDTAVSIVSPASVLAVQPYVLIYQRRF